MAKRKNPLKDLDSFLKQEASSLVEPEKITPPESSPVTPADVPLIGKTEVLDYFKELAIKDQHKFRSTILEILHGSLEYEGMEKASNKMLMNTLLYLQNQDNWKEAIAEYWSAR